MVFKRDEIQTVLKYANESDCYQRARCLGVVQRLKNTSKSSVNPMAHSVDKFFSYYLMEITRLRDLFTEKCARIVNEVR